MAAVALLGLDCPEIDDAAHPGSTSGGSEVLYPLLLQPVKIGPRPHGMHQIEDGIYARQRRQQCDGFEAVGEAKLHPLRQATGTARPGNHLVAEGLQVGHQIGTDISCRSHHQTISHPLFLFTCCALRLGKRTSTRMPIILPRHHLAT